MKYHIRLTFAYYIKQQFEGGGGSEAESFSIFLKEFCGPGIIELRFSGPSNFFQKDFVVRTMQQIYRRTPILKCDFNKNAKQLY